ncbi:13274_t:CDS:2, partial [Ambispora gerdemannii]
FSGTPIAFLSPPPVFAKEKASLSLLFRFVILARAPLRPTSHNRCDDAISTITTTSTSRITQTTSERRKNRENFNRPIIFRFQIFRINLLSLKKDGKEKLKDIKDEEAL